MVQLALDTTSMVFGSYLSWLTPITNMGASALGALMITFLAPPLKWAEAWGEGGGVMRGWEGLLGPAGQGGGADGRAHRELSKKTPPLQMGRGLKKKA